MLKGYFPLVRTQRGGNICPRDTVASVDPCQRQAALTRLCDDPGGSGHPLGGFSIPDGQQTIAVLKNKISRSQVPFFACLCDRHLDNPIGLPKQLDEFVFRLGGPKVLEIFLFRKRQGNPKYCTWEEKESYSEKTIRPLCKGGENPNPGIWKCSADAPDRAFHARHDLFHFSQKTMAGDPQGDGLHAGLSRFFDRITGSCQDPRDAPHHFTVFILFRLGQLLPGKERFMQFFWFIGFWSVLPAGR